MKIIKYLSFVLLSLVTASAQARFLSVDPVGFKEGNPMSFNRYAYANNNPYKYVDPDGREIAIASDLCSRSSEAFQRSTSQALTQLYLGSTGAAILINLTMSQNTIQIVPSSDGSNFTLADSDAAQRGLGSGSTINFNPNLRDGGTDVYGSSQRDPFIGLGHELGHADEMNRGIDDPDETSGKKPIFIPPGERGAIRTENGVRAEHNVPLRREF